MNPISDLIARSPIDPLERHIEAVTDCANQLRPFVEAVIADDKSQIESCHKRIIELEGKADDIKHKLRRRLPASLFLPVPRQDLLRLLDTQDRIANKTRDVAGLLVGRKLTVPEEMQGPLLELVDATIAATQQARKVVKELDELLETGFRGLEVELVEDMIDHLNRLETKTDELQVETRARLFAIEDDLKPVDAVFMYRMIDLIGDMGDKAQRVGSNLQILIAR